VQSPSRTALPPSAPRWGCPVSTRRHRGSGTPASPVPPWDDSARSVSGVRRRADPYPCVIVPPVWWCWVCRGRGAPPAAADRLKGPPHYAPHLCLLGMTRHGRCPVSAHLIVSGADGRSATCCTCSMASQALPRISLYIASPVPPGDDSARSVSGGYTPTSCRSYRPEPCSGPGAELG